MTGGISNSKKYRASLVFTFSVGVAFFSVVAWGGERFFSTPAKDGETYISPVARSLGTVNAAVISRTGGGVTHPLNFGLAKAGAPALTIKANDKAGAAAMAFRGKPKQSFLLVFPETAKMQRLGDASSGSSIEVKQFHTQSTSTLLAFDDRGRTLQQIGATRGAIGALPPGSYQGSFPVQVVFQ